MQKLKEARFTPQEDPDLANVALKGEMLRDFAQLLKDQAAAQEKIAATQPGDLQTSVLVKALRKISDKITSNLDEEGAQKYGIDMHDIARLVSEATEINAEQANAPDAAKLLTGAANGPAAEHKLKGVKEMFAAMTMRQFSMALAVQEGIERRFLNKSHGASTQKTRMILEQLPALMQNTAMLDQFLQLTVRGLVSHDVVMGSMKARGSKLTDIMGKMAYGDDYPTLRPVHGGAAGILDQVILRANNLDPNKKADLEKLRVAREGLIELTRKDLGLESPRKL